MARAKLSFEPVRVVAHDAHPLDGTLALCLGASEAPADVRELGGKGAEALRVDRRIGTGNGGRGPVLGARANSPQEAEAQQKT